MFPIKLFIHFYFVALSKPHELMLRIESAFINYRPQCCLLNSRETLVSIPRFCDLNSRETGTRVWGPGKPNNL